MPKAKKDRKIFVLDTSVILHDHNSIMNFQEHDVAVPITVLEELDNFKRGNDTKNFEAREFIRIIDKLSGNLTLSGWLPLNGPKKGKFRIVMMNEQRELDAEAIFRDKKADHRILNTALTLVEQERPARVILVTKDINLRIKAKALNLEAQDYETGKIKDLKNLNTGISNVENIESEVIRKIFTDGYIEQSDFLGKAKQPNQFYILKNGKSSALATYNPFKDVVERVEKLYTYGIKPKNAEQTFALHAILNPEIRLVSLQGVARERRFWHLPDLWNREGSTSRSYWPDPLFPLVTRTSDTFPAT